MIRNGILIVAALALAVPCFAQAGGASSTAANVLNIPSSQGIVAKLLTDLDSSKNKVGDTVLAETTRDIKDGHEMLLKKGSTLNGKIVKVDAGGHDSPGMIAILFDQVSPKGEGQKSLNVVIQAMAPAPTVSMDSLQDGRGMAQSNINAAVSGQDKDLGNGGELMATTTGVHGFSGIGLGSGNADGKQLAVIDSNAGTIKIKKGAQLVFKAPEQ
jgi:hypothetical protein